MSNDLISRLRETLIYEPDTGLFFRFKSLKPALYTNHPMGYKFGSVLGHRLLAHRVAFAVYHGYWPKIIDHVNRSRADNRIINLRDVTPSENSCNSERYDRAKGVSYLKSANRWIARRKGEYLGCFETYESAVDCAKKARSQKIA